MREIVQDVVNFGDRIIQRLKTSARVSSYSPKTHETLRSLTAEATRNINRIIDVLLALDVEERKDEPELPKNRTMETDDLAIVQRVHELMDRYFDETFVDGVSIQSVAVAKGVNPENARSANRQRKKLDLNIARMNYLFMAARLFDWRLELIDNENGEVVFDSHELEKTENPGVDMSFAFEAVLRNGITPVVRRYGSIYDAADDIDLLRPVLWSTVLKVIRVLDWSIVIHDVEGNKIFDTEDANACVNAG